MKITISGTGYVGLVTAVCMAEKGHFVTCMDVDEKKIGMLKAGKSPIYEDGFEELMNKNRNNITYTCDAALAYKNAEVIFIGVGTPERKDGSANLSYIYSVIKQIAEFVENDCTIVIKSTVPIGTNDKVEKILNETKKHKVKLYVVSNPEFLAQRTYTLGVKLTF